MNTYLLAGVLCAALIIVLEKIAPFIGLVDKPSSRKRHLGEVPLIGGLAVFGTMAILALVIGNPPIPVLLVVVGSVLVLLGLVDDVLSLSARFRLLIQLGVVSSLYLVGDMRIESVGALLGGEDIRLSGWVSYVFTVVCAIGVINAINMIDGLDGLAGSILLCSFLALGALALGHSSIHAPVLFALSSCLVAFLVFNNRLFRRKARIFMGDAGSMFLGLVLVWYFVKLTQTPYPTLSPISAGWIFGLPLMETVSVMVGRVLDKRSPFDAGRDHMHHRLRRAGFSVNLSVAIMLMFHVALVSVGVAFSQNDASGPYLFWGFVALTIVHFLVSRLYLEPIAAKAADTLYGPPPASQKKRRHNAT